MCSKRVLVLLGHPSDKSFGAALAEGYAEAGRQAGHEVRFLRLGQLDFDPVLHDGYRQAQALEPDLLVAQEAIAWAEHLTFIYPIWWGSLPALLKGFLDRTFLPGFAFRYEAGKALPNMLLKGRSAHLLVTMDAPPWYFRWVCLAPGIRQMKKNTLEFCGIRPVRTLCAGPILGADQGQRQAWLEKARRLAASL